MIETTSLACVFAVLIAAGPVETTPDPLRPDCPGRIVCPLTGKPVCKDRCPLDEAVVAPGMLAERDKADGAPVSLGLSLQPLIDHFNAGRGKTRFVAIVSSTCPACVFGAEAVKASVLDAYPDADIQVSVVWIDMLPSDNEGAALESSALFGDPPDPRLKQFHDPNRRTGRAFARDLLYEGGGVAWDMYLYYDKLAVWNDTLPKPVEWYHQLGGGKRADPSKFRPGEKLTTALREATGRVVERNPAALAPDGTEPAVASVGFNGTVLAIGGMTCQGCVAKVSDTLAGVAGVEKVDVSLETGLAWIRFGKDTTVEPSTLIGAVDESGFTASAPEASSVLSIPVALVDTGPRLELLSFPGCPTATVLHANLAEATSQLGLVNCRIEAVNLAELEAGDPRRGWGSPTVLVDGVDLFGKARPADEGMSCRIYPDGKAPSTEQITARLESRLTTDS